jgi:N-glycosyltransferase
MLPLVRALARAGHELLVVGPPGSAGVFDGEPVAVVTPLTELGDQMMAALQDGSVVLPPDVDRFDQRIWVLANCGPHITTNYRVLLPVARDFRPDLIIRDGSDFAGCLVAEALDVVSLPAPSGTGQFLDPALVMTVLNERRAEVGLPAAVDPLDIYRHGRLDCVPTELSFTRYQIPKAFAYRQPSSVTAAEILPAWLAELPADRPLVVAAGGTVLPQFSDEEAELPEWVTDNPLAAVPEAFIDGLSRVDCVAVVATGGIPVHPDKVGDNVHVVRHLPQPLLLQCAQLFVTHGGYNSIREAIRAGVPMAVLPLFGDQEHNAVRVTELGLGTRLGEVDTGDDVARQVTSLLADPAVTARARQAQRRMLALPPVGAAVGHLASLVGPTVP